jgi:peptidoglycan/LPS O-acetylase OafA/YrhL
VGTLRLILALAVVATHSHRTIFQILSGREAVVLFYTLSGFYMALILNRKYTGPGAVRAFLVSRFLRLWVPYVLVMALFVACLAATGQLGGIVEAYREAPRALGVYAVVANTLIAGQDLLFLLGFDANGVFYAPYDVNPLHNGSKLLLDFPMFSVSIELFLYLLAPLFIRSVRRTIAAFAVGVAYHVALRVLGVGGRLDVIYHWAPMGLLYFPLGALAWWSMERWLALDTPALSRRAFLTSAAVLGAAALSSRIIDAPLLVFYVLALPVLFRASRGLAFDRVLGELSYPVYLLHIPLITMVRHVRGQARGPLEGYVVSALALALAALIYVFVDRPLDAVRNRLAARLGGFAPGAAGDVGAPAAAGPARSVPAP